MEPGNVDGGGNSERSFQAVGFPVFPCLCNGGLGGRIQRKESREEIRV